MKKITRVVSIIFISVVLSVFLLVSGLHFYLKTEHARGIMLANLNEFINGELACRDISVSLFGGVIEIRDAVLNDYAGKKLASIDSLHMNLSLTGLFYGRLEVEHAALKSPWVYLGVDEKNELILIKAFSGQAGVKTEKKEFPFNVVIDELAITDGTVLYENYDRSIMADLSGIELEADADLYERSMYFSARAAKVSLTGEKIRTELKALSVRSSLKKEMLGPIMVQAETGFSQMSVKGSVRDISKDPGFDLICEASVSLAELKDALGMSEDLTGDMVVRLGLKGKLDDPEIMLHMDYGGGTVAGLKVDGADLDAVFIDKVLKVDNADFKSASGAVSSNGYFDLKGVFPDGIFTGKMEPDAVSYSLSIKAQGLDLERLPLNDVALKGKLNTDMDISGTGISPEVMSSRILAGISCERLEFDHNGHVMDVSVKARAEVEKSVARIDILEARSGNNTLEARGTLDLSSREITARMEIDAPDLKETLKPFGIDIEGRIAVAADISETISDPSFRASLKGKQIRLEGITLGDIAFTGGLDRQGIVRISDLILENKGSRIQGSGSVRLFEGFPRIRKEKPLNLYAKIHNVNVQDFYNAPGYTGILEGDILVQGRLDSPTAQINLDAAGVTFKDYRIGNVRSVMGLAGGTVSLDSVIVENNESSLHLSGALNLFDPETKHLVEDPQIRLTLRDSTVLLQDVADGLTGRVTAALSLEGSIKHPRGSVSITGDDIDLGFQKIDKILLLSTIEDQRIKVDKLNLVPGTGNKPVIGTGWIAFQGDYGFQLLASGLPLENIDILAANHVSKGQAEISLTGSGSFSRPSLRGEIILKDVFIDQDRLGDVGISIDLQDEILRLSGKQGLDFKASYMLGRGDFSASAVFDNLDLAPYFQIVRYPDLSGTVTGEVQGSGNIHSLQDIRASMDLKHLSILFMGREIIAGESLRADLAGKDISVPGIHLVLGEKGWVNIEGGGTLDEALSLRADGDIPLQVLDVFFEDLSDASGKALISGQLDLIDKKYVFRVDSELVDIAFLVPYTGQKVHGINGHIAVTPEAVALKDITGRSEKGRFNLSGTVGLSEMRPEEIDLRLQAFSLPIRVPDTMDLTADMAIAVRGTRDNTLMQGNVALLEGVYYRDVEVNLISEAVSGRPETRAPKKPVTLAFLRNMNLDISINRRNPVYVDNNLAQMDINPDIHITGTLNNPVLNGRASIESGTVVFRNRTFSVTKGVVDFLDPYATRPSIDIESETKVRDWMIYLEVTGTPEALNVSLRSDPAEEDNDILSLIVFGWTSEELIAGEGGSTLSTTSMIASLVASRYGEDIRKAAGLDILELETDIDDDSGDTLKLTIGKELSHRIMLKYAMESKNSELSQRTIAEYKLFENIVLNGFQDTRGIFGADIQYRLEFR